jgi:hypothetical protein
MNKNRSFTQGIIFFALATIMMMSSPIFMPANDVRALAKETESWFIHSEDSRWREDEMEMVSETLETTIFALNEAGFDGQTLLDGYRFRRYDGQFVDGVDGRIALVRHGSKEIILADTAFMRLWGYYIYHELGHVVDKRLDRKLSQQFHMLASDQADDSSVMTPDGFWLNEHARTDREEATADAFALWVVLRYTENPRPVFWHTPNTIDYDVIVQALDETMQEIEKRAA